MTGIAGIAVIAVGNVLAGDDALGPRVLEHLEAEGGLPPGIELLDAGTPGLGLTTFLAHLDVAILVDAVYAPGPAGRIVVLTGEEVLADAAGAGLADGPHQRGLRDALAALELLGAAPRKVLVIGAAAADIEPGAPMSQAVADAVPRVAQEVRRRLDAEL